MPFSPSHQFCRFVLMRKKEWVSERSLLTIYSVEILQLLYRRWITAAARSVHNMRRLLFFPSWLRKMLSSCKTIGAETNWPPLNSECSEMCDRVANLFYGLKSRIKNWKKICKEDIKWQRTIQSIVKSWYFVARYYDYYYFSKNTFLEETRHFQHRFVEGLSVIPV